jgi:hypothetical protein
VICTVFDIGVGVVEDADDHAVLGLVLNACIMLVGEVDTV